MVTASIEVSGPDAEALARELRAVMAGAAREGETVSAVELDRSPELVIAVIGLATCLLMALVTWLLPSRTP